MYSIGEHMLDVPAPADAIDDYAVAIIGHSLGGIISPIYAGVGFGAGGFKGILAIDCGDTQHKQSTGSHRARILVGGLLKVGGNSDWSRPMTLEITRPETEARIQRRP
jgi:hypothetical protein